MIRSQENCLIDNHRSAAYCSGMEPANDREGDYESNRLDRDGILAHFSLIFLVIELFC